jgi:hypothetical protein
MIRTYQILLRLYPASFRNEFEEQMLLDFADMVEDAGEKGSFAFLLFCLRESVDFPINLLQAHLRDGGMTRILHSRPVNYALRGAVGYSIGFAGITFVGWWTSRWLFAALDPMLQSYSIWYWETFQNERWIWLLDNFVTLLSYAFTGIFFGLLFALLMGDSQKRGSYLLAGSLAWFIPNVISNLLSNSFGWSFYLNENQVSILGKLNLILDGMFYSAALVIAESNHKESLRRLTIIALLYPLSVYLYIKLLFYLWLEITELFFPALIMLLLILIGRLFLIVVRNDKKFSGPILFGAVTYPILFYSAFHILYSFPPVPTMGGGIPSQNIVDLTLSHAITEGVLGICFGLVLGLVFGFQRKGKSFPLTT